MISWTTARTAWNQSKKYISIITTRANSVKKRLPKMNSRYCLPFDIPRYARFCASVPAMYAIIIHAQNLAERGIKAGRSINQQLYHHWLHPMGPSRKMTFQQKEATALLGVQKTRGIFCRLKTKPHRTHRILKTYRIFRRLKSPLQSHFSLKKKGGSPVTGWTPWRFIALAPTYSPEASTSVPSALTGLTALFGMGRGDPRRYRHQLFLDSIRLRRTEWQNLGRSSVL